MPDKKYFEYSDLEKKYLAITSTTLENDIQEKNNHKNLLNFCKENLSETLSLMMKRYDEGENYLVYLINDLLLPEYENIRQKVFEATINIRLTEDGKYIAPSPKAFNMRFFKELLKDNNVKNILTKRNDVYQPTNRDSTYKSSTKIELNNYPNPYNNSTIITFSLPNQMFVSLKIYNILGEAVETLINNELKNAGTYRISWEGVDKKNKQLSSGIYIYTLKTESQLISKKIQLLK